MADELFFSYSFSLAPVSGQFLPHIHINVSLPVSLKSIKNIFRKKKEFSNVCIILCSIPGEILRNIKIYFRSSFKSQG